MAIDNGRMAAFEALNDVLVKRSYADLAAKNRFKELDEREARFARKLLYQTLDKLFAIDSAILPWVDMENTPIRVINALRIGVCQLLYMNSVPDFAAVDSTVELAKQDGQQARAGVVNGAMRNVIRDGKEARLPDRELDLAAHLSVKYSWPRFVVDMWLKEQPEQAEALLAWEPKFHATVRANGLAGGSTEELEAFLIENKIEYEQCTAVDTAFRVKGSDITSWELFIQGKITVQGEASQLVSRAAAAAAGEGAQILDACAAPGGKSAAMADALNGRCLITAWDVHKHRVNLMNETFRRLKVDCVETELHDARFGDKRMFDFAIVDAPCSGLGVAWGSPDIKVSRRQEDIASLSQMQLKILRNVSELVVVGGRLVYSTCTISRAENEDIVNEFMRKERGYKPCALADFLPEGMKNRANGCMLQLLPTVDGTEGFFMALMQRVK